MLRKNKWIGLVLLFFFILGFAQQGEKLYALEQQQKELLAATAQTSQDIIDLREEVAYLEEEENLAVIARETLQMIYPSETLCIKITP